MATKVCSLPKQQKSLADVKKIFWNPEDFKQRIVKSSHNVCINPLQCHRFSCRPPKWTMCQCVPQFQAGLHSNMPNPNLYGSWTEPSAWAMKLCSAAHHHPHLHHNCLECPEAWSVLLAHIPRPHSFGLVRKDHLHAAMMVELCFSFG